MENEKDFRSKLDLLIEKIGEIDEVKPTASYLFKKVLEIDPANYNRWVEKERIPKKPMKLLTEQYGINPAYFEKENELIQLPNAPKKQRTKGVLMVKLIDSLEDQLAMVRKELNRITERSDQQEVILRHLESKFGKTREWEALPPHIKAYFE
jgi:uncharacterized coiled-coil protein SlyX